MSVTGAIDSAIHWTLTRVSPQRAAVRQHFHRMATDPDYADTFTALLRARGYRSAAPGSRNGGQWTGGGSSADAQIIPDLPKLRNRSRELLRDDSIAAGIVKTFTENVVGTGIRPQSRIADRARASALEACFRDATEDLFPAEGVSFVEATRLVYGKVLEDGDHFVKFSRDGAAPLWCESIEGDRVRSWPGTKTDSGNEIRDGVERDKATSRPVAYHVLARAPADVFSAGAAATWGPASRVLKEQVLHLKRATRSGQTRGVPIFHAVMQDLRDLDLLLLASLKRQQIAACLAVFIKSNVEIEDILAQTAKKIGYKLEQEIEPGMIFQLGLNEEVQMLTPPIPPEFIPFVTLLARKIGAALGVCWQLILKDFSGSNYSSARTDLLESRQTFTSWQQWLKDAFLTPTWTRVLQDARLRGDERVATATDDEIKAVTWIAPGWKWVDPLKEAKATEAELANGITTLRDVCAAQGKDWEEQIDQLAEERARIKAALGGDTLSYMQTAKAAAAPEAKPEPQPEGDNGDKEDEGNDE